MTNLEKAVARIRAVYTDDGLTDFEGADPAEDVKLLLAEFERLRAASHPVPSREKIARRLQQDGFTSRDGTYLQGGTFRVIDAILSLTGGTK